jgi:hypothetical protein
MQLRVNGRKQAGGRKPCAATGGWVGNHRMGLTGKAEVVVIMFQLIVVLQPTL